MSNQVPPPLTPEEFQTVTRVSDDTMGRLTDYAELLMRWQGSVNLVGKSSVEDLWRRHFLDSAQLCAHLPSRSGSGGARVALDIGSGGGFPGVVMAIIGDIHVHLVESNAKKCAFLRQLVRLTAASATVHGQRIEDMKSFAVDVFTARATASVSQLLDYAEPFIGSVGQCLLLKGRKHDEELTDSAKNWIMESEIIQSLTDRSGVILKLKGISRRDV